MQSKIRIIFLFLSLSVLSDSITYNTPNNHGIIGLINIPTARSYSSPATALTLYRGNPDRKITLAMNPYDWLEASFYYTSIKGRPYGGGFDQDYKDKGFNAKFILNEQNSLPALAIGFNDFAGTGIYTSEYIVTSYGINKIDLHLGLGWGRYNDDALSISNPLKQIDKRFSSRDAQTGKGGKLRIKDYFSGDKASFFGGLSYLIGQDLLFKFEIDPTNIPDFHGFPERSSNLSFGIEYIKNNFNVSVSYERGDYFGLKFSLKSDFLDYKPNQYKAINPSGNKINDLSNALETNNIGIKNLEVENNKIILHVRENKYFSKTNLDHNIVNALRNSDIYVEETLLSYSAAGLNFFESDYPLERKNNDTTSFINAHNYSSGLKVRPFIASRESFLKAALLYEINSELVITENLFVTNNIKYPIFHNFNDLYIPPVDTYPAQVRSDIKDYLNNYGTRFMIGRSQVDYFKSFDNHHFQITAGILEDMFSGYGFEYLWANVDSPFSIGFEAHNVRKRDYDMRFGHLPYRNITNHINLYYENKFLAPFTLHLSHGEYLAGDKGFTFDISRNFKGGIKMGAFFTRTNVTELQYGEGSFDKGIYFSIPLNGDLLSYSWRPLTKDPGAKLVRKNRLYSFAGKYKK